MDLQSEYFARHGMLGFVGVQDCVFLAHHPEKRKILCLIMTSINPRTHLSCNDCMDKTLSVEIQYINYGSLLFTSMCHFHPKDDNLLLEIKKQIGVDLIPIRLKNIDSMIVFIWNWIFGSNIKEEKFRTALMSHSNHENVKSFLNYIRDVTTNRKYLIC